MRRTRSGFTLVEMLVAVALVLLMMGMFATVFQIATGAMSKQKGLAENDQKARRMETLLRTDIQKRTYRIVLPMQTQIDPSKPAQQAGYFSISENDPTDDSDDVLSFTILTSLTAQNKDTSQVYGKSVQLIGDAYTQPEFDDRQMVANNSTLSTAAEVCYFIRNGNLYRRVMLLREPAVGSSDAIPRRSDGTPIITGPYGSGYTTNGSGTFWQDFDFVACNAGSFPHTDPMYDGTQEPVTFMPITSLSNSKSLRILGNGNETYQMGMPNMRFGHNVLLTGTRAGCPVEYINNGTEYIGRFTHEETSDPDFTYPGTWAPATYPMKPSVSDGYTFDPDGNGPLQPNGTIPLFQNGERRGEDLVLTNVHAFDVKVFDAHADVMDYRDPGYPSDPNDKYPDGRLKQPRGWYWAAKNMNRSYGPRTLGNGPDGQPGEAGKDDDEDGTADNASEKGWPGTDDPTNNVWDTWHPNYVVDLNSDGLMDSVPFMPNPLGTDDKPGKAGADDDNDGMVDNVPAVGPGELGWPGSDDNPSLTSIQIRLRILDPVSNQMRDVTLIESLTD